MRDFIKDSIALMALCGALYAALMTGYAIEPELMNARVHDAP